MRGEGLILTVLGLAGLGLAGLFVKRAFAAPEAPLPPEVPPPAPPVGEAVLVAAAEPECSAYVQAIEVH